MAKFLARRPQVIVMKAPSRARRFARRAAPHVRRVGRHAVRSLPTVGIAVGALAVGYAQGKGMLDKLPQIGGSKVITLGLAGYLATRFVRNPMIKQAGLAALAAAAFDLGRTQATGTSGLDDTFGDGGAGPESGQGY